jgi:hypothetical protein
MECAPTTTEEDDDCIAHIATAVAISCCKLRLQNTHKNTQPISLISVISSPNALPLEISRTNLLDEALVVIDLCKMSASQGS